LAELAAADIEQQKQKNITSAIQHQTQAVAANEARFVARFMFSSFDFCACFVQKLVIEYL
jgi:hypothetical protein